MRKCAKNWESSIKFATSWESTVKITQACFSSYESANCYLFVIQYKFLRGGWEGNQRSFPVCCQKILKEMKNYRKDRPKLIMSVSISTCKTVHLICKNIVERMCWVYDTHLALVFVNKELQNKYQGRNSQNFLSKFVRFFITLSLKILRL